MNTTAPKRPSALRAATRAILIGSIALRLGTLSHAVTINSTYLGTQDGPWEVPTNWSPGQVPGNSGSTVFNVIGSNDENILLSSTRTIQNLELTNGTELTLAGGAAARVFTVTGTTSLDHDDDAEVTVRTGAADATMLLGTLENFSGGTLQDGFYTLESTSAGFATLRFNNAAITRLDSASVSLTGANTRLTNQAGVDALTNLNRIENGGELDLRRGRNFTTSGNFSLGAEDDENDSGYLTISTRGGTPTEITTTFTVSGSFANYSAATSTLTGGRYQVESGNGGQFARIRFANTGITTLRNASVSLSGPNGFMANLANQDALVNLCGPRGWIFWGWKTVTTSRPREISPSVPPSSIC